MAALLEEPAIPPLDASRSDEAGPAPFPHALVLAVLAALGLLAFAFWHPVGYEMFLGRLGVFCL